MVMSDDIIKEALIRFKKRLEDARAGRETVAPPSTEADLQLVRLAIKKYNKREAWRRHSRPQPNAGLSPPL
jgi:hypothetical protein